MNDSNFPAETEDEFRDVSSSSPATWEPDSDVVTQRVEGETVLVHLQTNEIYTLSKTASRGWDLLVTGLTRDEVQEELQREFDAPPEQIGGELDTLIANLVEKKLLRPTGA
jgi:Coenzyme PQQ synthesis protein D (PqqD)